MRKQQHSSNPPELSAWATPAPRKSASVTAPVAHHPESDSNTRAILPRDPDKQGTTADSPNLFATQNLYQAAYCLCRGFQLTGKRRDGAKASVIFEGEHVTEEAMRFYNHGTVEA